MTSQEIIALEARVKIELNNSHKVLPNHTKEFDINKSHKRRFIKIRAQRLEIQIYIQKHIEVQRRRGYDCKEIKSTSYNRLSSRAAYQHPLKEKKD